MKPGSCRPVNINYRAKCFTCLEEKGEKSHYIGESHRSLTDRLGEHLKDLKAKKSTNSLVKHWDECHSNRKEAPIYSFEVIGTFRSSLERQIQEALTIENEECDRIINSKGEWGRNLIPRLVNKEENEGDSSTLLPQNSNNKKRARDDDQPALQDSFKSQFKQRKIQRKTGK